MSDWRKILVVYIKHVQICSGGEAYFVGSGTPVETELTNVERESLDAAVREAMSAVKKNLLDYSDDDGGPKSLSDQAGERPPGLRQTSNS